MRTSLQPGHHKNHLIWVDSSLMVHWASLRLLASNNKDQPAPPDHLQNLLIQVDAIKVIPLTFAQYVSGSPSRIPQLNPPTLVISHQLKQWFNWFYMYMLSILCIVHHSDFSLFNCRVIDYFRLLLLLCIILIFEMYSRYFDPIEVNP